MTAASRDVGTTHPGGPGRSQTPDLEPLGLMLAALRFAADKHRHQRRKGEDGSPYLHHCIEVADTLAAQGGVTDPEVLAAAILHDTLEDTDATPDELTRCFGDRVRRIVEEVSDDRALTRDRRRELQVEKAPSLSPEAKLIKLADKICNVGDVAHAPPVGWSTERRREYVEWTARVVAGCRGANPTLEGHYDRLLAEARRALAGS
jgi:guanosine-3',5'-bis(diphosphate) 3'-pyrophosphohydrolase